MDEIQLKKWKEHSAWTTHVREVTDCYRIEMESFPVGSSEYEQWMQKLIKFMEDSNLRSDELLWELANISGVDYIQIRKESEIETQKIVDEIRRNKDKE